MSDQFSVAIHGCLDMGWSMLVTWGEKEIFGRWFHSHILSVSLLFSGSSRHLPSAGGWAAACRPFVKGKIILAGQQLYRMEWLELYGTEKMVVVREKLSTEPLGACPSLVEAGRLAGATRDSRFPLEETCTSLTYPEISQQEFLPASALSLAL